MEFRDKLLGSEMRHITELVNMLSFELVIIQDFMSQEFGARFKKFREKHVLYCEGGSSEGGPTPNVSTRRSQGMSRPQTRISVKSTSGAGEIASSSATRKATQDLTDVNEDPLVDMKSQTGTSDMLLDNDEYDQPLVDENGDISLSDSNFAPNDANDDTHFVSTNSNDYVEGESDVDSDDSRADQSWSERNDRRTSSGKPIWEKFDWKRLPDGKRVVKCKKCLKQVSPVAKRLEKHYQQCVLNKTDTSLFGVGNTPTASTSSSEKKPRKPLSVVWSHFDKITSPDGFIFVTCKYCEKKCSNHATRMGRHLAMCKKCPDDITT